jgi:hypothetical protein
MCGYSSRKATIGSTRTARLAGRIRAAIEVAVMTTITPRNVIGSVGLTP